jgi:hypothetical protein
MAEVEDRGLGVRSQHGSLHESDVGIAVAEVGEQRDQA